MAADYPFPVLGHGAGISDEFAAWVVFREQLPSVNDSILDELPAGLHGEGFDRVFCLRSDELVERYDTKKKHQRFVKALDEWLTAAHAHHPIRFAVIAGADLDDENDPWDVWSRTKVKKVLLPWFVEAWKATPALHRRDGVRVLAELIARSTKTRREDVIALAARAIDAALGHDEEVDRELARSLATMIDRLPDDRSKAQAIVELSPLLRLLVWSHAEDFDDLKPTVEVVKEDIGAIAAPPAHAGEDLAQIAEYLESVELHALALELPGAPFESLLEVIAVVRGKELERILAAHVGRYATIQSNLSVLLHRAVELELEPLIRRCLEAARDQPDAPDIISNVLYATSKAGRAHETIKIAREFVLRGGGKRDGRMLATLYTNILLAYGACASCDDVSRAVTLELEKILDEDPGYFGFSGDRNRDIRDGRAGRDILASAYGSAACGRAVMGDGEAAARWLSRAKQHAWAELATCANLVCFQHLKDDPHVKPVVAEIARSEVARLEASLRGNKTNVAAMFGIALTLHNGGFNDEAERYYRKVLAKDARHADSLNNLGNIFGVRGDYDAAIDQYDAALEVVPDHPLFHACKAWALARAKRYREAIAVGDRTIALAPNQSGGYFARGAGWLGLGDRDKAAADFRRGAALNPGWRGSEKDDPWFSDMVAMVDT